jgi:uroporphyrinogen decarboxylase
VADLTRLQERPGDGPPFDRQLEIIDRLARQVGGQVPMTTTVFHAWMVLRTLLAPPKDLHRPPVIEVRDDPRDTSLTRFLREDRPAVAAALQAIGRTLANFARACLQAGADGIYLATRDDWVDTPANRETTADADVYDELVAETDREILSAAATGWFNVLHLCGRPLRFDRQISHPNIHVIHWADRVTGPAMADACSLLDAAAPSDRQRRPVPAGGVNNLSTLARGRPADVTAEVVNAIAAAGEGPLIVAPGCTYDPDVVPDENIHAMVAAARRPRRQ